MAASICRQVLLVLVYTVVLVAAQAKSKRQIYREQVLPHSGGKIPEDAFRADRLALNRLNKEGIAVPDGVLLEHRSVHSHPHINKHDPEDEDAIIRIIQQSETRYAPVEGRYQNESPLSVASTYIIRRPIGREETNIRPPEQQQPHHQAIYRQQSLPQRPQHYQHVPPTRYSQPEPPQVHHNHQQHRFHHVTEPKMPSYHSIPVPFELPNREIQSERYFLKNYETSFPYGNEVSGRIDWPLLLDNFGKVPSDLNNALPPTGYDSYDYDPSSYQYFDPPESLHHYGNFFSFGDRFTRKSAESFVKGTKKVSGHQLEPRKSDSSRGAIKRLSTVKCTKLTQVGSKCQVY